MASMSLYIAFYTSVAKALAALALARLYTPQDPLQTDLTGQTAIVTGANSGIGLSIATSLAKQGATVYLACRNREKGAAAVKAIVSNLNTTGDAAAEKRVLLLPLDVSDLHSVRDFCSNWSAENTGLKIKMLVHNAGIAEPPRNVRPTDEKGRNLIHVTNFLGSFLMTRLLEGRLSDDARVVFTSSTGHFGAIDTVLDARPPGRSSEKKDAQGLFERAMGWFKGWFGWDDSPAPAYYLSKAHQVLFASLLQEHFDKASSANTRSAHAFSPGFSSTAIFDDFSLGWRTWVSSPLFALLKVSHRYVAVSTDEAAKTGVWLAACGGRGDDGKVVGGGYWEWMERKMSLVDFERARLGEDVFRERVKGVWRAWPDDTGCEWDVEI